MSDFTHKLKRAEFVKNEEFWCHDCDGVKVHSDKPETGYFFMEVGHVYDFDKKKALGDWPIIIFAICTECLK